MDFFFGFWIFDDWISCSHDGQDNDDDPDFTLPSLPSFFCFFEVWPVFWLFSPGLPVLPSFTGFCSLVRVVTFKVTVDWVLPSFESGPSFSWAEVVDITRFT